MPASASPHDEGTLAVAKPRRYRNKDHLRYVARQACLICGRTPSDPHHLRYAQPRALGRKASDESTVPLCRVHHREVHRLDNEQAWWQTAGIDPLSVAEKLWNKTLVDEGRLEGGAEASEPQSVQAAATGIPAGQAAKPPRKGKAQMARRAQRTKPHDGNRPAPT